MKTAASIISNDISKALKGCSLTSIKSLDERLIQLKGELAELNLSSNIISVVSLGVLKSLAISKSLPLYKCNSLIT
jgi:enolase